MLSLGYFQKKKKGFHDFTNHILCLVIFDSVPTFFGIGLQASCPLCFLRAQHCLTLKIIVVGVLGHSAVQEGPGKIVYGILLVLHCLGDYLSIEVVMKTVIQMRFNWQRLIKELLKEVLIQRKKAKFAKIMTHQWERTFIA